MKNLFSLWLSLIPAYLLASNTDTLYYRGHVNVGKKVSYKYNLRFVINADNSISGYSLTDAGGLFETKTRIIGSFNKDNNSISFTENKVLRSKVDTIKGGLCYIKATLAFKKDKLFETTLTGNYTGINPKDNSTCGNGEIKLINTQKVKKVLDDANRISDFKKNEVFDSKKRQSDEIVKISDDNPRSFLFQEQDIKITVWDNGIVDGDRIAVIVNGKYLLRDYTLDSVKKTMQISLPKEVDDIAVVVFPLNEGTEPPNTATIILESLSDSYTIELRAKKNEVRKIYLARRREKKEKNN